VTLLIAATLPEDPFPAAAADLLALSAAAAAAAWLLLAGPSVTLSGVTSRATVWPSKGRTAALTNTGSSIIAKGIFSWRARTPEKQKT
jgi:hypothetical protein